MPPSEQKLFRSEIIRSLIFGVMIILALFAIYKVMEGAGALEILTQRTKLLEWIRELGGFGPVVVIFAMTIAIVFSPIPSAPIALAAGAAFGHGWGTLYVLIGSAMGAILAFSISRFAGHGFMRQWLGERMNVGLLGSQNALMVTVFATRLMPFISFDIISYAAGLTVLKFWRFAIATVAGILPASFLLAHFGSDLATGDLTTVTTTVIILGGIALLPMLIGILRK